MMAGSGSSGAARPARVDNCFRRLQLAIGGAIQPQPRRQRRAEDDGDHRRRAGDRRLPRATFGDPVLGRSWPRTPRLRSARCRAAGASSARWASKITRLQPVGGFAAETGGAITLFIATHAGDPGQHDAHDHRRDRRRRLDAAAVGRALGRRGARSSGHGCSPSRARRSSLRSPTSASCCCSASPDRRVIMRTGLHQGQQCTSS